MALRDDDGWSEKRDQPEGAYEHPALEPETGYWAGRWLEFKRLFARSWNDGYTKETVYLCAAAWVLVAVVELFNGWG